MFAEEQRPPNQSNFLQNLLCAGQIKIFKRISWVQMFHIIPGLGQYLMFLGFFFFFFLFFFTFPIGKGVLVGMVVLAERKNVCIYPFQSLYYCQLQLELKSIQLWQQDFMSLNTPMTGQQFASTVGRIFWVKVCIHVMLAFQFQVPIDQVALSLLK